MKHIAILIHKKQSFIQPVFFLQKMACIWQQQGYRVTILHGVNKYVEADILFLHVNLTVVPDDYIDFCKCYPVVINGAVIDNSKRSFSKFILTRSDVYNGPVIVKTNRNCGGKQEENISFIKKLVHPISKRIPLSIFAKTLKVYPVFDSITNVPPLVWYNPYLVVEKLVSEVENDKYCLRTWLFFGDKEVNSRSFSKVPVVKSYNIVHREAVSEVPSYLRKIRQEMGFDFGKFDYGIVDGNVVLYDVNRTPTLGGLTKERVPSVDLLSEGINSFL